MSHLVIAVTSAIAGIAIGAFGKWTFKKLRRIVKKAKGLREEWED